MNLTVLVKCLIFTKSLKFLFFLERRMHCVPTVFRSPFICFSFKKGHNYLIFSNSPGKTLWWNKGKPNGACMWCNNLLSVIFPFARTKAVIKVLITARLRIIRECIGPVRLPKISKRWLFLTTFIQIQLWSH